MKCNTAHKELLAFDRGELRAPEAARLRAHIALCATCQHELAANRRLSGLVARLMGAPRPTFVADFMHSLRHPLGALPTLQAGVEAAAFEIREVIDEQVEHARQVVLGVRQRAWPIAISVASHAAVILVIACLIVENRPTIEERAWVSLTLKQMGTELLMGSEEATGSLGSSLADVAGSTLSVGEADPQNADGSPGELVQEPSLQDQELSTPRRPAPLVTAPASDPARFERIRPIPTELNRDRPGQNTELLAHRSDPGQRRSTLAEYAPAQSVEDAIADALAFLAREQLRDGSWDPAKSGGNPSLRAAVSALATLPFLAEGFDSAGSSRYSREVVAPAIAYLESIQNPATGSILAEEGSRGMFNHAVATLALAENLALLTQRSGTSEAGTAASELPRRAARARLAVDFLRKTQLLAVSSDSSARSARASVSGGWGYRPNSPATDTNVSAWGVQALLAYEGAVRKRSTIDLHSIERSYRGTQLWLRAYTDPLTGQVGYDGFRRYGRYGPTTLTAVGLMAGVVTGAHPKASLAAAQEKLLLGEAPTFTLRGYAEPDFSCGYFTSLALYLKSPRSAGFRRWYRQAIDDLLELQVHTGKQGGAANQQAGSWPAICRWSSYGGNLYTTSLALLTLQMPYRFSP